MRIIVVAELVVALLTGITVAYGYQRIDGKIDAGEKIPHKVKRPEQRLPTSALNILVMGTDSRDGAGNRIDSEAGEGGSDTTILIHVAKGRKSAYAISIPRDTLVDRPECSNGDTVVPAATDQIWNLAYKLGGPDCTAQQLEAVTGIYVDNYVAVDFSGFKKMVDAIDGVQVCIPTAIDDSVAHIHFDAGTQVLDGDQALKYVRERHSTANSDLGRMKRQQAFIASMIGKIGEAGTLTHPTRLYKFAEALAGSLKADPDLASASDLVQLASSLKDAHLQTIRFVTAPTTDFPRDDPNWGRLKLTPEATQLWQKVKNDQPLGTFGQGAISVRKPNGSKQEAAANGLCS